jgi:hypothetical protein
MPSDPMFDTAKKMVEMTRPLPPIEDNRGPLVYNVTTEESLNGVLPQDMSWKAPKGS